MLDEAGNVFASGKFNDTVDFYPGQGTYFLGNKPHRNTSYIQKLNAKGELIRVKANKTVFKDLSGC